MRADDIVAKPLCVRFKRRFDIFFFDKGFFVCFCRLLTNRDDVNVRLMSEPRRLHDWLSENRRRRQLPQQRRVPHLRRRARASRQAALCPRQTIERRAYGLLKNVNFLRENRIRTSACGHGH